MKILKVGFGQAWDFEDAGVKEKDWGKEIALILAKQKAGVVGCHINKSPEWFEDVLYFTVYRYYNISESPGIKANSFALRRNFDYDDPFACTGAEAKNFKIVTDLPIGCKLFLF